MKGITIRKKSGVTLTELLVVLAIIGLLATIAVPVYVNRAEQAKRKVAQQEVKAIAEAEDLCAITHGFYVPIQVLDDNPDIGDTNADSIDNEDPGLYVIDVGVNTDVQQNSQPQLNDGDTNQKIANLVAYWQGPFLNPTRVWYDVSRYDNAWDETMSTTDRRRDFPLDPWGQPYRMYSDLGVVGTNALGDNYNLDSFSDGRLTDNDDRFDRFTIVSFGPDGLRDTDPARSVTNPEDDIVHYFGAVVSETAYYYF